jgi:hypothetical protein
VGIEVPLELQFRDGLKFVAYLDIVIRDTVLNKYRIVDIKTSMNGWNKYQKKDAKKLSQLVLYKIFFAKQFKVDPKDIDVEFIVVKRKLWENAEFPQKRVQKVTPANGTIKQNEVLTNFTVFVNTVFDENGQHKAGATYPKFPSPKACKYCEYASDKSICDRKKERVPKPRKLI